MSLNLRQLTVLREVYAMSLKLQLWVPDYSSDLLSLHVTNHKKGRGYDVPEACQKPLGAGGSTLSRQLWRWATTQPGK